MKSEANLVRDISFARNINNSKHYTVMNFFFRVWNKVMINGIDVNFCLRPGDVLEILKDQNEQIKKQNLITSRK